MSDRMHSLINEINTSTDDSLQSDKKPKTDGDFTEPQLSTPLYDLILLT
jgi:hypothetical protein